GICARPDFGVGIGQTKRQVRDSYAGRCAEPGPCIRELEGPVLVIAASRNSADINLVSIILAGSFKIETGLERVSPPNLGDRVANCVNRAGGMRGIRSAGQSAEVRNGDRRDFARNVLANGHEIWIVNAELLPVEPRCGGDDRDVNIVKADRDTS